MGLPAPLAITVHDYMGMREGPPFYELVEGELFISPLPLRYHQKISVNIEFMILAYLEGNPIGELYHAPCGVFLSEINVYMPDILFVSKERGEYLVDRGIDGAPNFIVEILSPSTAASDKGAKKKIYGQ